MPGRLEDGVRLAADVEEPRVGEELEEQLDPAGVRRRLQEHRPVLAQRQLLEEQHECRLPARDVRLGNSAEGEKAFVIGRVPRERPEHVGRAERQGAGGELVLVRHLQPLRHAVDQTGCRDQTRDLAGAVLLGAEEGVREEDLVEVRVGELIVQRQHVVQHRGAAPPVAEDEQRRVHPTLGQPGAEGFHLLARNSEFSPHPAVRIAACGQ